MLICAVAGVVLGFSTYKAKIPNGNNVINPCDGSPWPGVGHRNHSGGGARNQFGLDFADEFYTWTNDLCQKDSDGDGITNGFELGDANCDWTASDPNANLDAVRGHPGVCEPLDSDRCRNSWFSCSTESSSHGPPVGR